MRPLLQAIDAVLMELHQRIHSGECATTEEQEERFLKLLRLVSDKEQRVSKYEACKYLGVSRATFDRLVHDGFLPKGEKRQGFKELSWSLKELDCYFENKVV